MKTEVGVRDGNQGRETKEYNQFLDGLVIIFNVGSNKYLWDHEPIP